MSTLKLPRTQIIAFVALAIAAASWGSSATFIKFALEFFEPMTLLFVQLVAANVILWTAVFIRGIRRPVNLGRVLVLGLLEPGICYTLLTIGLTFTSAANAAILSSLESFFTVLLAAYFLKEALRLRSIAAVLIALIGVLVLEFTGGFNGVHLGDALVLIGILAASFYAIVARTIAANNDALTMTAYQFTVGLMFVGPFAIFNWATSAETLFQPRPVSAWIAAVSVGILGYGGSFLLYNFALAHVRAGVASMSLNLLPVFGLLTAVIFLGEPLTLSGVIGALFILVAVIVFTRNAVEENDTAITDAVEYVGPGTRDEPN